MVLLLHGNGLMSLSNKISQIKKDFDPLTTVELSGKDTSFNNAYLEVLTPQLFSESRLFILEDFNDLDLREINDLKNTTIIFKFNKLLPKNSTILKSAQDKRIQIISFEEPGETPIFPFLDKLGDKNPSALGEFEKFHSEWGGQYVLTMIGYLLRRLVLTSKKAPAFIKERVDRQKRNFSLTQLKDLYKSLVETDYKIKSGLIEEKIAITLLVEKIIQK